MNRAIAIFPNFSEGLGKVRGKKSILLKAADHLRVDGWGIFMIPW
jgi:hypothetical protein